jgi:hypothetical protein
MATPVPAPAPAPAPTVTSPAPPAAPASAINSKGYFDLSGLFQLNKAYLVDISNGYTSENPDQTTAKLQNLKTNLATLGTAYQNANSSATAVLAQQGAMLNIVNQEQDRIAKKQAAMATTTTTQQRVLDLNDSNRKKMIEYTKILLIFVAALFLFFVLQKLNAWFPEIPDWIVDYSAILIFSIAAIYSLVIYIKMQGHEPTNFDQIYMPPPRMLTPSQRAAQEAEAAKSGNLLGTVNLGQCTGAACCASGTYWDISSGMCVLDKPVTQGFEPMYPELPTNTLIQPNDARFYVSGGAGANEPNEFTHYVPYL